MDPDEALRRFRELCDGEAVDAAALMLDLDEWLSKGGFLPQAWARARPARGIYSCGLCSRTCHIDGTPFDEGPCSETHDGRHAVDVEHAHRHAHDAETFDAECEYCQFKAKTDRSEGQKILAAHRAALITRDEVAIELGKLAGVDVRCLFGECPHDEDHRVR